MTDRPSKRFTDNAGREWLVDVNVATVKRVRTALDVNLLDVVDDNCRLLARLFDDPVLLVDVLFCVCREQADDRGVSDEEFGRSMAGDAILAAANALMQGLEDFFLEARKREAFRAILAKMRAVEGLLVDAALKEIEAIKPESVAMTVIDSSGSLPASSASTPTAAP